MFHNKDEHTFEDSDFRQVFTSKLDSTALNIKNEQNESQLNFQYFDPKIYNADKVPMYSLGNGTFDKTMFTFTKPSIDIDTLSELNEVSKSMTVLGDKYRSRKSKKSKTLHEDTDISSLNYMQYISNCFKRQFHESIQFIKLIGSGTYADVYNVKVNCNSYALKVFRIKDGNKFMKNDKLLIKKELDIMNHLKSHPCILECINYIKVERLNIVCIVMPLMTHDLNKLVENYNLWSNFDESKIIDIMYKILCGVRHMHKAKICHRDLKPSNILIDLDERKVKIADFGLSGLASDDFELIQSQSYRAPEIVLDEFHNYDESIDIWSIGLIFCFLIHERHIIIKQDRKKIPSNELIKMIINLVGFDNEGDMEFVKNIQNRNAKNYTESYIAKLANTDFKKDIDNIFLEDNDLKDLIKNMLFLNPKIRISAEKAIQHPYLTSFRSNYSESLRKKFECTRPNLYIEKYN